VVISEREERQRALPGLVVLPPAHALPDRNPCHVQKERGGYYTPDRIAAVLARWAIHSPHLSVLEPGAGDGQLVVAAEQLLGEGGRITAVELHPDEADKIRARTGPRTTVVPGDFFAWFRDCAQPASFDAVIGNPPFIRYQQFREEQRRVAFALMAKEGLHPSRLTNAWLPFVAVATRALKPGGRLALILPAELLQVTYAAELREYLVRKYTHLTVVTFRQLVFDGILQETVLLLGERGNSSGARMAFVELDVLEDLTIERVTGVDEVEADLDHGREKWTQFYLSPAELGLVRELEASRSFGRLGHYAEVDVGVVTGRNEFFVLNRKQATDHGLLDACLPLVGRSAQTPGLVLRAEDWQQLADANGRCYLLQLGDTHRSRLSAPARAYVALGEQLGYHRGYKCRIRLPNWWKVPSVWVPDAFLLRQIYDGPRIILNRAGAVSTDTIHRVRAKAGIDASSLAAASLNSLTFAFSEIHGRSYGGGVLELEPTEAEGLPFPKPTILDATLDELDGLVRTKGVETALREVDRQVLKPVGLSECDIEALRGIWCKLYRRRMSRKRR